MAIDSNTELYCLIGHPVSKSRSPYIHNKVFKELGINAKYLSFDVEKHRLEDAIKGIRAMGIKGFNVTIPHKVNVIEYLDDIDKEASLIGAVNTVKNVGGKLIGYNTDGLGFSKSLDKNLVNVKDKGVLIVGAGGASRAISIIMAKLGAKRIHIANRTIDKGKELTDYLKEHFSNTQYSWGDLNNIKIDNNVDIVVNTTPIGMYPDENKSPFAEDKMKEGKIVVDIIYKPEKTKLLKIAEDNMCKIVGGLDMLIYQGLYSSKIWLDLEEIDNLYENIVGKKDILK